MTQDPRAPDPYITKLEAAESDLRSIQDDVALASVHDAMGELDTQIRDLPGAIQQLRTRGYVFKKYLENKAEVLAGQWADLRGGRHRRRGREHPPAPRRRRPGADAHDQPAHLSQRERGRRHPGRHRHAGEPGQRRPVGHRQHVPAHARQRQPDPGPAQGRQLGPGSGGQRLLQALPRRGRGGRREGPVDDQREGGAPRASSSSPRTGCCSSSARRSSPRRCSSSPRPSRRCRS